MSRTKSFLVLGLALITGLSQAASPGARCSFESQIAPDEQALLDNVKSALTPMSSNPACQAQAAQIRTFDQALTAYNAQSNALNNGGISCMNYESEWNSRFDRFANNWNDPTAGSDEFSSCRGKGNREEAINCAALITGRQKSEKRVACEAQKDNLTTAASQELRTKTFQTGLTAINDVLANPDCIQTAGERRLQVIQSAVGLASQAATIALLGTGMGLLVGAAAQVVNAAIGNIFRNPSRQALAVLDNRDNFSRIACLYEQVETKALRCERISASRQVDVLKNLFDTSTTYCAENADVLQHSELMTNVDQLIRALNVTPAEGQPAGTLSADTFDSLVEQLNRPFPGSEESRLEVAESSAREVKERLDSALTDDASLSRYLQEAQGITNQTGTQLRRHQREITAERDRAAAVLAIITAVKDADAKGTRMTAEDRANVEKSIRGFNAGDKSFSGVFNEIMTTRASFGDDYSQRLRAYNTRLDLARLHSQNVSLYQNLNRVSSSSFEDGGRFSEARSAIAPHLHRILHREMETLIDRVRGLSDINPGAPSRALQETLRTQEESVIYPMLRACSQLRTVMARTARNGTIHAGSEGQPSVCQAFNCGNGLSTFENYLRTNNVQGIDVSRCDVNCRAQFDRFVCQERSSLSAARAKVRDEFLRNGTICGKSIRDAFKDAEGP